MNADPEYEHFGDELYSNAEGAKIIAEAVYGTLHPSIHSS